MTKLILLPLLICSCLFSIGQIVSVSADANNILYAGYPAPLTIAVENNSCKSIVVKTNFGKISGTNGSYLFFSSQVGRAEITIYSNTNGKLKKIGTRYFRVSKIPDPVFKIGSGHNKVPKIEIASQQYVRADIEVEGFNFELHVNIDSFTVCIVSKDSCRYTEIVNRTGNVISDEVRNEFKTLKNNDIVIFKDIYASLPSRRLILSPSMVIIYE